VTVPDEDETAGSGGAGNKSTSAQEKLSDEEPSVDNPLMKEQVDVKDSRLLDGEITRYEQASCLA
jgi:hypothetical protein